MTSVMTHRMGSKCGVCQGVLIEDGLCRCGQPHGYAYQMPSAWAASAFPEHECFKNGGDE